MAKVSDESHPFSAYKFMKIRRPDEFSDTFERASYRLSSSELDHWLTTLTERNAHTPFEDFCVALGRRELCRELRPMTGPDAGGDGKVDSESYHISEDVARRFFDGRDRATGDRWAVACSLQKTWQRKCRADVQKIIATQRGYYRIVFFTNQNPKASARLKLQDELSAKYSVSVEIHDRSWLLHMTIENGHADLAHTHLDVGELVGETVLGPQDYQRSEKLSEFEKQLTGKTDKSVSNRDAVSISMEAAILSRELERPRRETEKRFERTTRLAEAYGSVYQKLEAQYAWVWTSIFWFNDPPTASARYDKVAEHAYSFNAPQGFEKLSTLLNVFTTEQVRFGVEADFKLESRRKKLEQALDKIIADTASPNRSLYAQTVKVVSQLNPAFLSGVDSRVDKLWSELSEILDRSHGLGEFPVELIDSIITAIIDIPDADSESLDQVAMKLAEVARERAAEGREGDILLRRGLVKLERKLHRDAVSWLGKAVTAFSKQEYQHERIHALIALSDAYRGLNLIWAARGCIMSAAVEFEGFTLSEGGLTSQTARIYSHLAHLSLECGLIIDHLLAVTMTNLHVNNISMPEPLLEKLAQESLSMDMFLACAVSNWPSERIEHMRQIPDCLEALGLFISRDALIFRFTENLTPRSPGLLELTTDERNLSEVVSRLASQPVIEQINAVPILDDDTPFMATTYLAGIPIQIVASSGGPASSAAEYFITMFEALFSTLDIDDIIPFAHKATVWFTEKEGPINSKVVASDYMLAVDWPSGLEPANFVMGSDYPPKVLAIAAQLFELIGVSSNQEELLEYLAGRDRAFERATNITNVGLMRGRVFGRPRRSLAEVYSFLGDTLPKTWGKKGVSKNVIPYKGTNSAKDDEDAPLAKERISRSQWVINPYLWKIAEWRGMGFMVDQSSSPTPPVIALAFTNTLAGRRIIDQWRDRMGASSGSEVGLALSITRQISETNQHDYMVVISQDEKVESDNHYLPGSIMARSLTMMPETSRNLEAFIAGFEKTGEAALIAADMAANFQDYVAASGVCITKIKFYTASELKEDSLEAHFLARERARS